MAPLSPSSVSVNENPVAGLSVYPNPSNGVLNVEYADANDLQFNIYATDGRLVKTGVLSGFSQIDLNDLNSGLYVVQLSNENSLSTLNILKK